MAANNNPVNLSQPYVLKFMGEDYGKWSLRMKTLFHSKELWELVEKGVGNSDDKATQCENKKRDVKALCFIQQAVDKPI